ncbi:LacI family DNA-binding transcriptional regulator [Ruania alkalisoli]|uniref:LacI family DNA-binding transcriptional regulator n=1 Tax=Ruania alkalisoli TaxID=2779775 RepID=A0A7M1SZG8_9MICO|nr:LacI family DNA-binding transcriptional regulator [Ruania alkalisoli]
MNLPTEPNHRPTSRDVARLAGVSVSTVSNVLNRPDLVTDGTRERVEHAMHELRFVRNRSARELRMGKGRTIGLLVYDISGPYSIAVARAAERHLTEAGYMVMLCSSDGQPDRERRQLLELEEHGVSGIVIGPTSHDLATVDEIRERGTPVVLLDRASPDGEHCSVAVDDVKGAEQAGRHLLALGHRRIGLVNGPHDRRQCHDRRRGLHQAVEEAGLKVDATVVEVVVPEPDAAAGEASVGEVMKGRRPPTAVMCINDRLALGVLRGLQERGIRSPEDVAVVGYDDLEFAAMLSPRLTSIRRPKEEYGRRVAELLLDEIENATTHVHQQMVFQTGLAVRESSDLPRP